MIAGVSGMRANGLKMDVIGNNIANLNTVGYKSHKALFSDLISQTMSGGTAAVLGTQGGQNPVQVGLGVQLASIASDFSQGSLMSTGKITDLAISGEGFFVLDNGSAVLYSRDGAFGLDTNNQLVNPANGYKVQGWMTDDDGVVSALGEVGDITIPFGSSMIAEPTTEISLVGNLDSSGDNGLSAISASGIMYEDNTQTVRATGSTLLTDLYDASGNSLNLESGDYLTIGATKGAGTITTRTFTIGETGTTLDELREFMEHTFGITGDANTSHTEGVLISGTDAGETDGQLVIVSNIGDANAITEITISGTDVGGLQVLSTTAFQQIFGPDVGNNGFTEVQEGDGESSFTQTTVYDCLGQAHTVDLVFARVSENLYSFFANADDNFLAGSRGTSVRPQAGILQFTHCGANTTFSGNSLILELTNGAATPMTVDFDGSELTGYGATTSVNVGAQNGFPPGNLNSFTIGEDGLITGIYSNGLTRDIAQIALATFPNEEGLLLQGGNLYAPGVNSGVVSIGRALVDGRGSINSGYLENSNVDLAEEFSQMIITQRAYQANARTINVADALLAESVNLV